MQDRLVVKKGLSIAADTRQAVRELVDQIQQPDASVVIFFCSSHYDLDAMGSALKASFDCPLIGCTTAGEITESGYLQGSIVAVSLKSEELKVHPRLLNQLKEFDLIAAENIIQDIRGELTLVDSLDPKRIFGLLLIDGMSLLEEQVIALMCNPLDQIPVIGGSAGDDLDFEKTFVYWNGRFLSDAAVFTLFETTLPFEVFQTQHFDPTGVRLVITASDCATRTVTEINGGPAAQEYAEAIGLDIAALTPQIFAAHPVMLKIGGEYFVRSIQKANPDGSLTFFCAIDNGLVLTVAKGHALLENLHQRFCDIRNKLPNVKLVLGCDCILRRLELQEKNLLGEAAKTLLGSEFIGFSTYGEQYNGIHVNQTLTGIALGI